MRWKLQHPKCTQAMLGFIPSFLSEADPRSAREQLDDNYRHGGGWSPFQGFTVLPDGNLKYPGDPPTQLLAEAKLREEVIRFYEHSWVSITQPDGSVEIAHLD